MLTTFIHRSNQMIVITTPAGAIGRQVLDLVLNSGAPVRVVAREPSRIPAAVRARIEIVQGSHGDAGVIERALAGADAVFWLPPPPYTAASVEAGYLDFTRPFCEALGRHGVRRVVGVSALGRGSGVRTGHAGLATASQAMDDMIGATGVAYRALTMPSFMDNLLRQVAPIRDQGMFFSPLDGDRKLPTCANRDIAAVAAGLLLDRDWSGQRDAPVLGPQDLSFHDMARIMTEVLDKPVSFQQIGFDAYKAQLLANGMPEGMAQAMVDMMVAKNEGLDNAEPRTAANSTPTSFRQWCEDTLKPAVLAG
jgi:uncharacterized protein YbjT (DUF2867 family)